MPDVFTKTKRSEVMSLIRGRGNRNTEIALVRLLRQNKIVGWRRHLPIFGRPDFVFSKQKLAVFVDGCFWHGCPKHFNMPASNRAFWKKKISGNKARDQRVNHELRKCGWRVIRIWEHHLSKRPDFCVSRIKKLTSLVLTSTT